MTDETMAQEAPEAAPQEAAEPPVEPVEAEEIATPEAEPAPKKNGKIDDWIDFDALPAEQREQVESRIRTLSGQVKKSYEINDQLVKDLRSLHDRMNNWEVGQNAQRVQGEINRLKAEYQEAFDSGDGAKAFDISQKVAALQAQSSIPAPQKRDEPAAQQPQHGLPEAEVTAINRWAAKRPYIDEGDNRAWVQTQLTEMYQDPDWDWQPVEEKLKEVDRRHKARTKPKQADVLTTSPDQPNRDTRKAKWQSLNEQQRAVAVRMFPEHSRENAYKAYAEGMD